MKMFGDDRRRCVIATGQGTTDLARGLNIRSEIAIMDLFGCCWLLARKRGMRISRDVCDDLPCMHAPPCA